MGVDLDRAADRPRVGRDPEAAAERVLTDFGPECEPSERETVASALEAWLEARFDGDRCEWSEIVPGSLLLEIAALHAANRMRCLGRRGCRGLRDRGLRGRPEDHHAHDHHGY